MVELLSVLRDITGVIVIFGAIFMACSLLLRAWNPTGDEYGRLILICVLLLIARGAI